MDANDAPARYKHILVFVNSMAGVDIKNNCMKNLKRGKESVGYSAFTLLSGDVCSQRHVGHVELPPITQINVFLVVIYNGIRL